ncbi:MAG: site-specific integrase [Deltaproteobacteria bacterium]|nr:site-specific integrase [Deltaproteobacteria bacterium]
MKPPEEKLRGDGYLYRRPGSSLWWAKYYLNGKPQRFSTGKTDERQARVALRKRVAAALSGIAAPESARRLRYAELEKGLFDDYKVNERRTLADLPRAVAPLRAAFAGMKALDITTARIRAYAAVRLEAKAAPATVNKELAALGRMFTLAVRDGRLMSRPIIPKLHVENARTGFLDPADFEAFCAALPDYLRGPARFAYLTGWRKREVFAMPWRQVNLATGSVRLEASQSKNGQARLLAFGPDSEIARVLADAGKQRRLDCLLVFHHNGRPIRSHYGAWRKAATATGLGGLMLHDFRRSAARNLVRAGVPERVAMAVTGHKTRAIFDRYNIVNEADLREADSKVGAYVRERATDETGHNSGTVGRKVVTLQEAAKV